MKILAFMGWKNSGKTFIANHLKEHYKFEIMNFSDPLKDIVSQLFGIDRNILDGNDEKTRTIKESKNDYWSEKLNMEISPRTLLTGIGMALRNWNPDIWVALLEHRLNTSKSEYIVVPDLRLENEYQMLKKYNTFFVWIIHDRKDWMTMGMKAAMGDEDSIKYMEKKNIHVTEYQWLKFVTECDFIYKNDKKGINSLYIEKLLEKAEEKWTNATK